MNGKGEVKIFQLIAPNISSNTMAQRASLRNKSLARYLFQLVKFCRTLNGQLITTDCQLVSNLQRSLVIWIVTQHSSLIKITAVSETTCNCRPTVMKALIDQE